MRRTLALVLLAWASPLRAQGAPQPTLENLAARRWFQDAKFGMFVHWGVSSLLMDGEWVLENRGIAIAEYQRIAAYFNPAKFDADAWVALARDAGMRYITLITKHHDGFALFDSRVSDWDVMDRTPFRRDVVREMAEACRRQGLRLFVYYSQLDWHHPDYFPRGRTGHRSGRPESGRWEAYLDFMDAQLRELFTNYGPLGGVWFDGMWDRPDADWRLERTYGLIHQLQPAALIIPNHHQAPLPGEDVQTFEKDLPGANTAGWNTTTVSHDLPLETSETIGEAWGFRLTDRNLKSVPQLIRLLVQAAGRNANFLLNIGPMPDGSIVPEQAERLRAVGAWLERYGASIYGTRGGPVPPRPWGVTTHRGDTVYVHVLDWADPELSLPPLPGRVRAARVLDGGAPVRFRESPSGVTLRLPPRDSATVDQVITLRLAPVAQQPDWAFGPFAKPQAFNPVITPTPASVFPSPMGDSTVRWEEYATFNPAAVVKDGKVYLLYRAEDASGEARIGHHTSRIGLAESADGLRFTRRTTPVLYPDRDAQARYEWPGGVEDPRIVEREDGTYVLTYTQWDRRVPRLAVATSTDLVAWRKHGPAFANAAGGKYLRSETKSGAILARVVGERLVATKINGKYWMYFGVPEIRIATSDDLLDWTPVEDAEGRAVSVLAPRPGFFDSWLVEPGPPAILTEHGIVLLYNAGNSETQGDRRLPGRAYSAGQALFDPDDPVQLIARLPEPFIQPTEPYERTGQYAAGTTFVEGLVPFKGRWFLYYGTADSRVGAAIWGPGREPWRMRNDSASSRAACRPESRPMRRRQCFRRTPRIRFSQRPPSPSGPQRREPPPRLPRSRDCARPAA